ncbi:hypothetical protein GCM10008983_00370 [Lentibacillus halophilus]|uniref:Uncharacterized protein n=1 Tax=Lentibacillus halophilus TaxID=295065 RepID=A0ABN0Z114_9BACI
MKNKEISIIGDNQLIDNNDLGYYVYKSLRMSTKLKNGITVERLRSNIFHTELIFHPMWLAKLLVIADRKPFPSKEIPMIGFVDAVSGYRGLSSSLKTNKYSIDPANMIAPKIEEYDDVTRYIQDVQHRQINRSYVLKKPNHKIVDYFLVYLPLWKVKLSGDLLPDSRIINAITGESETYLSDQWGTDKWYLKTY